MKITNPTVFLKDGELFCLTVELPKDPNIIDYAPEDQHIARNNYQDNLASAKSSAVKVKNSNDFLGLQIISPVTGFLLPIKENESYQLEGYEAEVYNACHIGGKACEDISSPECLCWDPTNIIATITPINQERESQDELWNEILDTCQTHFINDIRLLEKLKGVFTIQRKSK